MKLSEENVSLNRNIALEVNDDEIMKLPEESVLPNKNTPLQLNDDYNVDVVKGYTPDVEKIDNTEERIK